jgi:NAD(P)-dependent dehydrogenase (short-subunit alcohol dehydrogenase family)
MRMNLLDKNVAVVGGSSGIGFAVARAALAKGARVDVVGRSRDKLARAASELGANGVRTHVADIGKEAEVAELARALGEVDHLVVTAVSAAYQPLRSFDLDAARRVIDSKLVGPFLLAKHVRLRSGGSIVFTSGIASARPMPSGSMVAAANGALDSLVRALALELAPLRVNAVSPGWVDTPAWDSIAGAGKSAAFEQMAKRLPVGRVGRPEDLAHAYMFLLENEFTTGTVLHVDGGHALV